MVGCNCTLCMAKNLGLADGRDARQLLQTIEPERADELEWYIQHEYTPISLAELPASNEQLFWDALGVLAFTEKFVYRDGDSSIEVGDGKLAVASADNRREYECLSQMRTDAQHGDPIAAVGVQLAEEAIRYRHADREDYHSCYRFAGPDWAVDVNLDEEVVHIDLKDANDKCWTYLRYGLEEFLASQDPLVSEAREWVLEELPDLLQ